MEHQRHLTDTHLIKFHMMTGTDEFYNVVLAKYKNEKSKLKIEKFIETIESIPTAKEVKKNGTDTKER